MARKPAGANVESEHKKKKAAVYIRVSTRWQLDGDSLPFQRTEIPKYVQYALGIEDYEIFEDAGYSGKNMDRPEYQRMMSRIREGEFSHIVVWKLDRISRNLLDFAGMYKELRSLGVTFVSKNEQFDTSSYIGEAILKIILVFAELERNMTSERVSNIMVNRAQNGQWNGGKVPYGYAWDKESKTFSLVDNEVKVCNLIYDKYESTRSLLQVARWLNDNNYRARSGHLWNPVTVRNILVSPWYSGGYRYNFYDESDKSFKRKKQSEWIVLQDHHPGIVDQERQSRIEEILQSNDRSCAVMRSYSRKHVHVFAGLLICGSCGSQFQATIDRPRAKTGYRPSIYLCSKHRRSNDCDNKYISDIVLGPFVLNFLANYIKAKRSYGRSTDVHTLEKKLLRGKYFEGLRIDLSSLRDIESYFRFEKFNEPLPDSFLVHGSSSTPNELNLLQREKARLERGIQRLRALYLFGDNAMSEADYIKENAKLSDDLAKVDERLASLVGEQSDVEATREFMETASAYVIIEEITSSRIVDYDELITIIDKSVLKEFVNYAIKNICIHQGKVVSILMKNGPEIRFLPRTFVEA